MPFNSDSYYRNKWRRQALEYLAKARTIKAEPPVDVRVRLFGADYQSRDIESAVKLARSSWRMYLAQARICRANEEVRRLR